MNSCQDRELTQAELKAIDVHKYYLSKKAGRDVGIEHAIADWMMHHSRRWRESRLKKELDEQLVEILRHKWIESEKAGRDIGERAIIDWIENYAHCWRQWKKNQ